MRVKYKITRYDNITPADFGVAASEAEKRLAQRMARDTEEFVPFLSGKFAKNTRVINNLVIYQGDQVRYLYEGVKMVNAATGKGPRLIPDVGPRWPKYAELAPTSEPLTFTKSEHPLAQSHWMDASERKNGKKWADLAEEAITRELTK